MTENAEHVIDALAAYALGSLDAAEHGRVEAHVAICPSCAARLTEYRALVGVLPLALTPVATSSSAPLVPICTWTTRRL